MSFPWRSNADGRGGLSRRRFLQISGRIGLGTLAAGTAAAAGGAGLLGWGIPWARGALADLHLVRRTEDVLGTALTIQAMTDHPAQAQRAIDQAFREIARLDGILSVHRPDTPLMDLNREGGLRSAPPELLAVLQRAQQFHGLTGGAFDVTIKPVLDLYLDSFRQTGQAPDPEALERRRELVGASRLVISPDGRVELPQSGMGVILDGLAKGYVIDRVTEVLRAGGVRHALIDAGDARALGGKEPGRAWRLGVRDPRHSSGDGGAPLDVLGLQDRAVATSGDYERFFTPDRRLHHVIDPRTATSPGELSAVSVTAPSAMDANALAVSAMVLGREPGAALIRSFPGATALMVTKLGEVIKLPGWGR